jgi:iron complex transport system permease protein
VNVCAIFAGIHFYTQWFEHLGASPGAVLGAGVGTVFLATALARYNKRDPA